MTLEVEVTREILATVFALAAATAAVAVAVVVVVVVDLFVVLVGGGRWRHLHAVGQVCHR